MVKRVTAPKTYDPGRGRPLEHLAYLNRREMDYLRSINGNNMERGPRGLPSFPPDDSLGSSSSTSRAGQGGGGKTGGSSGSSGGATGGGSKGAPSSGRAPAAKAPTAPSPKTPTAPTSPMSGQKTSFSSPSAASSYNKDVALKTGLEKNNAISAVKNTPAIKNDGVTGFKAQSLGVKPIGKTTIGGSRPASPIGPANRDMEVNRNLDRIARDFYNSDPDYQKGLAQQRATVAKSRESVGLLGKGVSPRDTISSPARTAPSTGMTQSEKQALLDKYNPVKAAGRLSDAVSSAASKIYNDPVGTASSGLNSLSEYMRDSYNTIAAGSLSSDPDLRSAAAEKAAEIALNYGIGGLGTSFATKAIPENSIGAFVSPRVSPRPEMQMAANKAEAMWDKYKYSPASDYPDIDREVFDATKRMLSQDVSGVQSMKGNLAVEISDPYAPKVSGVGSPMKYGDVFEKGPLSYYVPQVNDVNVISDKAAMKRGNIGYYSPSGISDPYGGITGTIREYRDMALGRSGEIPGPGISINSFDPKVLGRLESGLTPGKVAAHEVGGHYMNDISGGLYKDQRPVGSSVYSDALMHASPTMTKEQADAIGRAMYENHIEEQAARKLEGRIGLPGSYIRQYENRFANFTPDELKAALESKLQRNRYGVTALLRNRYGI